MNHKNNFKEWYRFAMMYAQAASFLMDKRGPPYEAVCCLGCLSAECAMKGFLLERNPGIPLPDPHNLRELCQACAWFENDFDCLLDECQDMARFTFPTMEKADLGDALGVMDTAQDVLRLTAYSQEQSQGPTMSM